MSSLTRPFRASSRYSTSVVTSPARSLRLLPHSLPRLRTLVRLLGCAALLVLLLTAYQFASERVTQHWEAARRNSEAARRKTELCETVIRKVETVSESKAVSWPLALVPLALGFFNQPSEETNDPVPIRLRLQPELAEQAEFEAKELELMKALAANTKKPFFRFYLTAHNVGFSSYMNNGLNALLMARRVGIPFQFVVKPDWVFVSWNSFFNDWSADVSDPEYRMFDNEGRHSCASHHTFNTLESPREAQEEACVSPFQNDWAGFRAVSGQLEGNDGIDALFQVKRRQAQAIWHLKPELQCFVDAVVEHVFNAEAESPPLLVGVHIRRGDKIRAEGKDLKVSDFATRVLTRIPEIRTYRRTLVLTFSDDDGVISEFEQELMSMAVSQGLPNGTLQVLTMSQLLPRFLLNYTTQKRSGYSHGAFGVMSKEEKLAHARDFILTLSLNRFVDYFVATFSSNVGRLAALLRYESRLNTSLSLDDSWHHV